MLERTYPRHVHQRGGVYQVVADESAYEQAIADGWVDHPPVDWPVPDSYREWDGRPLSDYTTIPDAEDVSLPARRKRGRPKKEAPV